MIQLKSFLLIKCFLLLSMSLHAQNCDKDDAYTPEKGTEERQAILNVLREKVYEMHHVKVIFVVNYLKVYDAWAWIHVMPEQADGPNRYEDILALIQKEENQWKIMEIPCTEEENPDCITSKNYYAGLIERFPAMAKCILPMDQQ